MDTADIATILVLALTTFGVVISHMEWRKPR